MPQPSAHLAIDIGAESGRGVVGLLHNGAEGQRLEMNEVLRFANPPMVQGADLLWDVEGLRRAMILCLRSAHVFCSARGLALASVGVDTWGVDYGLLDATGLLVAPPRMYRDSRHTRGLALLNARIAPAERFARVGVAPSSINTLAQVCGHSSEAPAEVAKAARLALMPDLLHEMLGGQAVNELTIASTTEMLDPVSRGWRVEHMRAGGVQDAWLRCPTPPGTPIGVVKRDIAGRAGIGYEIQIVVPASHDTASAVAAVPASGDTKAPTDWAFLSSGTWSLIGVEVPAPILTKEARDGGFTHELGVSGSVRVQKNLVGLYLVQEIRRELKARGRAYSYDQLTALAAAVGPSKVNIDVNDTALAAPMTSARADGMLARLAAQAQRTGQPAPETFAHAVRGCLEGLARAYADTLEGCAKLTGIRPTVLHAVGGGSQNRLLNQMTADACGVPVIAGPVEATSIGNVLVQAMGLALVPDRHEIRRIVARSCPVETFSPTPVAKPTRRPAGAKRSAR